MPFSDFHFSSQKALTPEGLVYCPLSKKLQPIKPPKAQKEKKPFDPICAGPKTGLLGMKERAEQLGGEIESLIGNGTTVYLRVPTRFDKTKT